MALVVEGQGDSGEVKKQEKLLFPRSYLHMALVDWHSNL